MNLQPIYLVCGVPGSGKTWVCKQLTDEFHYIPHDDYKVSDYGKVLYQAASRANKPILAEAPFRISVLIEELNNLGLKVIPYFVIESKETVTRRYEAREGRPILKMHLTRIPTVKERARQYRAPNGTSEQVLQMLRALVI